MKFPLVLLVLVALWSQSSGQGSRAHVYCGRHLARTMALLCQEVEEEGVVKRAGDVSGDEYAGGWRWMSLGGARSKRGIIEECCDQPCTQDVLLSYC